MKAFHNGTVGKIVILFFAIAAHALLAAGAFFIGQFLGGIIFADLPALINPFAIGYAGVVFLGAMWTFVYAEYAHEDVRAYGLHKGQPWFIAYFYIVLIAVMGSELAGVLYRALHASSRIDQYIVAVIGIFLLAITYALGKVLHAIVNSPLHVHVERAINEVGRDLITETLRHKKDMTPDEKRRFVRGDMGAVNEATHRRETQVLDDRDMKIQTKASRQQEKQARREQERAARERHSRAAERLLGGDEKGNGRYYSFNDPRNDPDFLGAQSSQADHLSQN